ncbi:hypothetical protein ABIE37_000320 [Arthrobacter bambusae]|uniref:Uncharacterized protein n=1 Tax=Arthrobacter bambusae TaxID=1338426 RepID=A0ABV2P1C9_9MICC
MQKTRSVAGPLRPLRKSSLRVNPNGMSGLSATAYVVKFNLVTTKPHLVAFSGRSAVAFSGSRPTEAASSNFTTIGGVTAYTMVPFSFDFACRIWCEITMKKSDAVCMTSR